MFAFGFSVFFTFYLGTSALTADELFTICHKNDPNLDKCLINSLHKMKPTLKAGIPQLKIHSLDPMLVQSIGLKQGSGPVSINSTFTDLKIYGMTDYTIKKVVPDLGNYRLDFEGELPALHNEGGYSISGKILVLPITGQGKSWSNYTGVSVKASLICSPKTKGNKLYWNVDDFMFDLDVKNAIIHMDNLFNGNKELGDAMNAFMSENWEVVFKELKPVVNEAVSALLKDVAVKVFSRFPIDQLLPD